LAISTDCGTPCAFVCAARKLTPSITALASNIVFFIIILHRWFPSRSIATLRRALAVVVDLNQTGILLLSLPKTLSGEDSPNNRIEACSRAMVTILRLPIGALRDCIKSRGGKPLKEAQSRPMPPLRRCRIGTNSGEAVSYDRSCGWRSWRRFRGLRVLAAGRKDHNCRQHDGYGWPIYRGEKATIASRAHIRGTTCDGA
jgi:hypothetical protein